MKTEVSLIVWSFRVSVPINPEFRRGGGGHFYDCFSLGGHFDKQHVERGSVFLVMF